MNSYTPVCYYDQNQRGVNFRAVYVTQRSAVVAAFPVCAPRPYPHRARLQDSPRPAVTEHPLARPADVNTKNVTI